jgi:hypothetical protein
MHEKANAREEMSNSRRKDVRMDEKKVGCKLD